MRILSSAPCSSHVLHGDGNGTNNSRFLSVLNEKIGRQTFFPDLKEEFSQWWLEYPTSNTHRGWVLSLAPFYWWRHWLSWTLAQVFRLTVTSGQTPPNKYWPDTSCVQNCSATKRGMLYGAGKPISAAPDANLLSAWTNYISLDTDLKFATLD